VCLVGTAPPRRCGIATFTDDLRGALTGLAPPTEAIQVAVTDSGVYDYGADVVYEVQASQLSDYRAAAEFIKTADIDLVCVQHEFGIFGGRAGRYIDELLDHLRAPVVTTLHTVLAEPPSDLRDATRRVADRSDRLVVLADQAVGLLVEAYGISADRVTVIPHGVPNMAAVEPDDAKAAIGAEGRFVVLTFGLLSAAKGIEVALDALPAVVAAHRDVLYIVLGPTHPQVQRVDGEAYRTSLRSQVSRLGLEDHVRFDDRYVDLEDLCLFLSAADLYVTPYHNVEQIVSGTLAYAVGLGRAVVSTPYRYAQELLAEARGRLVPFADPAALAGALNVLISDPAGRARMRKLAHDHGRRMTWPAVAHAYQKLFADVVESHEQRPAAPPVQLVRPTPSFAYLRSLTDDTGVFQHACHGVPDRIHGYCTDDIGRALVAAVRGVARCDDPVAATLLPTYLSFLRSAQREDGRFANLLGYDRCFVTGTDSEDTLGQAVWGLGTVVSGSTEEGWRALACELLGRAVPAVAELTAIRAAAYAICGLHGYLERLPGALAVRRVMQRLAAGLESHLDEHHTPGWAWFEPKLTYGNAKVPHALLLAGRACDHERWITTGLTTLDFLVEVTFVAGRFDFVGNAGWYPRGGPRAQYGQQPIEAGYMAEACMEAYGVTGGLRYLELAQAAVDWFLGRNRLGQPLYDPATGRCADGLDRHGVSDNGGAESVVCALLALLAVPTAEGLVGGAEVRRAGATSD
jgi:glycosyltransferase involved in cell wall biosynthesis